MRRLLLILALLFIPLPLNAQQGNTVLILFSAAPTGTCSFNMVAVDGSNDDFYDCDSTGNWNKVGPGAAGAVDWDSINSPAAGNQSLAMVNFFTDWVWGTATGTSTMFDLRDTTANTGTGYVFSVSTAGTSAAKPIRITDGGLVNGVEMSTAAVLQAIGTGSILADDLQTNTIGALTDFDPNLCAASEILERQGAVWACITTPAGGNVDLLDGSVHQDTTAGTVVRGDLITGQTATPLWTRLALGGTNLYPKSDGTDVVYSTLAAGGVGSCTNQFVRALNADAVPTCATVVAADKDLTEAQTWTGLHTFVPSGLGGLTDFDISIGDTDGTPTYGVVRMGDGIIGRVSFVSGSLDLDGAIMIRNVGGAVTSNIEYVFADSSNNVRFALATTGADMGSYSPRSLIAAGPAPANSNMVNCDTWTADNTNIDCDTATTGADLFVQDDLEVEGLIYVWEGIAFEGATGNAFHNTVVTVDPTAARTTSLPDADSNTVQPFTCGSTDKVSAISSLGVITCTADEDSGGAPTLDSITAAVGSASINNGDNDIVWNWSLTTASRIGFQIGENVASVAATDPVLVDIATLTASTAHPLEVTARGTANGIRVGATDGIVIALGTGGLDWPALLNYPTACSNQFVRAILDTPTCETVVPGDMDLTATYAFSATANTFVGTSYTSSDADPAETGVIRAGNDEDILCAERATPGVDVCMHLNTDDDWEFQRDLSWHSGTVFIGILTHNNSANRAYDFPDAAGEVSILGQTIDLTAEVTGILPGANGGTNNGFVQISGPTTSLKTWTGPDASVNLLTDNAAVTNAQGGTGIDTGSSIGILRIDSGTTTVTELSGDIATSGSNATLIQAGVVASAELATANKTFDKSIDLIDPTTGDDDLIQWLHGKAVTYTSVNCSTDAGTVTIDMDHRVLTTPNTVGTDILTGTIVCDTDNQADGGFADATIPANVPVNLSITAVSGAGVVRIHIVGTVD